MQLPNYLGKEKEEVTEKEKTAEVTENNER